jgi:endonuclease VIII
LLDQRAMAGIGNVYKSEILFAARVSPFATVAQLSADQVALLVRLSVSLMRANVADLDPSVVATSSSLRRTTGRMDPSARLWVYGRVGRPCRRCGTPIQRVKQGPDARSTYWCARCQPPAADAGARLGT